MQNKPFDAFEERLQKAAEQPVNGGEEAAWVRMEKLLDAPKRRRLALPLWWWLADAFMLLGIGLLLMKGIDNQPTVVNFGQREAAIAPAPAAADGLATASANTGNVAKGTASLLPPPLTRSTPVQVPMNLSVLVLKHRPQAAIPHRPKKRKLAGCHGSWR
jgi:hypothetical protein